MGVSAAVTMDTGMFIFCACADAHIHCCLSIKWVDQGVVYSIQLSSYLAWLKNKGVRIIVASFTGLFWGGSLMIVRPGIEARIIEVLYTVIIKRN